MPALTVRLAIPSLLTSVRFLAVPGVILLSLRGLRIEALGLYALVLLSDVVDGWAARRLDAETRFGAYLDVLADMTVILALLSMFCACGAVPIWLPAAPVVVAAAFLFASRRSAPRYDPLGKYYGTVLYALIGVLLWGAAPEVCTALCWVIIALSAAVLVNGRAWRRRAETRG